MAKREKENLDQKNVTDLVTQKKNPAILGLFIFFSVIAVIVLVVITVIIPTINKSLNNIGIKSVNEFVDFYKEVNRYTPESDVVKNPYSTDDYENACETFIDVGLDIFDGSGSSAKISEEKIEQYIEEGFPEYTPITLTSSELASLMSNALKNKNIIKDLNVELIEKYSLLLEIKELTVESADEENAFNFKAVGKISLKGVAQSIPWPYNGMIPDEIYVAVSSIITYEDEITKFENCEIQINNVSKKTHQTIIDVINSQIRNKDIEPLTLDGVSENINKIIYEKIESFAALLSGKIKIVLSENDEVLFEFTYVEKTA